MKPGTLNHEHSVRRFHRLVGICFFAWLVYTLVHFLGGHERAVSIHLTGAIATGCVWAMGTFFPSKILLAGHLNLGVATLTLAIHAWNGALLNDSAWFLCLIPLFAAYQLGSRAAIGWTVAVSGILLVLPLMAAHYDPKPEWLLDQKEVNRNRILLVWLMSALAVASASETMQPSSRSTWATRLLPAPMPPARPMTGGPDRVTGAPGTTWSPRHHP